MLASALKDAGIKAGEKVGIYAGNCPEWMLCILAANRSSISVGARLKLYRVGRHHCLSISGRVHG